MLKVECLDARAASDRLTQRRLRLHAKAVTRRVHPHLAVREGAMPCDVRKRPGQARLCLLQRAAKVEAGEGDDVVTLTYSGIRIEGLDKSGSVEIVTISLSAFVDVKRIVPSITRRSISSANAGGLSGACLPALSAVLRACRVIGVFLTRSEAGEGCMLTGVDGGCGVDVGCTLMGVDGGGGDWDGAGAGADADEGAGADADAGACGWLGV
eukprot:CAMPEP_0174705522 /NCGR_PEP_ID=MMETSP1094-20130205/8719_1 /TAXON_ID=156173 /ORGANISM="Chrysochromulina brevifilum, Strain UTEX LB 985" /LENGTH=210 /DNA_ID=CAMNT_0015903699 /DNA_START=226 /DNA_END=860 /DNA_ORIENTATION=-